MGRAMGDLRAQARKAARSLHQDTEGRTLPNAYADVASDVWEAEVKRLQEEAMSDKTMMERAIAAVEKAERYAERAEGAYDMGGPANDAYSAHYSRLANQWANVATALVAVIQARVKT